MIISASRRTDIPAFYSDWFFHRLKAGSVVTRNPMNHSQIKHISLLPDDVDCFVFWSKNPQPMLSRLDELSDYQYYFQFTLTSYGNDIETHLPRKTELIDTFQRLSDKIGAERVIWRYDPIFITPKYTIDYHIHYFGEIAYRLKGYTNSGIIGFIDLYPKSQKRFPIGELSFDEKNQIAEYFSVIAKENRMKLCTCAEEINLSHHGIEHASCIDRNLIERLIDKPLKVKADNNQRTACGCAASVDIGVYNTCLNGCLYCYANYSDNTILSNMKNHDPSSPIMIGNI